MLQGGLGETDDFGFAWYPSLDIPLLFGWIWLALEALKWVLFTMTMDRFWY